MGNQPGKLQTPQSGRPKKNVHWKSAGKSKECGKLNENKKYSRNRSPFRKYISNWL